MTVRDSAMRMLIGFTLLLSGCADVTQEHQLIREHLALQDGLTVADVGAGDGDFTAWFAGEVGASGKVYATEIGADAIADLTSRFADAPNVEVRTATPTSTGLPDACCDIIFLRAVYHHLTDPAATLTDMHRALKPGGTLLVIDFKPTWLLSPWTPENLPEDRTGHGVLPEQIVAEATAAGFKHEANLEWPSRVFVDHHAVRLSRPD